MSFKNKSIEMEERVLDSGYYGDEDFYLVECDQCGAHFQTDNENNYFCSKSCYKAAKADWES